MEYDSTETGPGNDTVETRSRFRAWWLSTFWGYRIDNVTRTPEAGSFGRIRYKSVYRLQADTGTE